MNNDLLKYIVIGSGPLLPSEPRLEHPAQAHLLTEEHLLPKLADLEVFFLVVRESVDSVVCAAQPIKHDKPYPLGQCLEITLAVQKYLQVLDPNSLPIRAQSGYRALKRFLAAKGSMRRVWGDLRGQYFQNALLIGALYVDVSNDTVVVTKPKVEILPFEYSGLCPIQDYAHFAHIAEKYWKEEAWPNHVLPELAPAFPVLTISKQGHVTLRDSGEYLVALNFRHAFRLAESYLSRSPMPKAAFDMITKRLKDSPYRLASTSERGRRQAILAVRTYRAKRWHQQLQMQQRLLSWGKAVNRILSKTRQVIAHPAGQSLIKPKEPNLSTIKIDSIEYNTDSLPLEALQQLQMLQATDAEISRLNNQLAIAQTARIAYANALKAALASATKL